MKDRSIYAWMLVAALVYYWVEPIPCAAQPPVLPSPVQPPTALPAVNAREAQGVRDLPPALPPTQPPTPAGPGTADRRRRPHHPWPPVLRLKAAPFEPTDVRFPINLATALRLSDARPLIVAAAQARIWVAEAELTQAKVLWLPDLNIGFDYIRHDGGGPDFNKGIMTAPSTNFFYAGAGLWGNDLGIIHTTDAIYQPLVARQVLNAQHWNIQTAKNDALLQTADAYFMVHQYRGIYAGALYMVERARDLVERIAPLSRDLVPDVRGRPGPQHARRPRAAGRRGAAAVARPERQTHARCSGSTPARWSSRWSTTTSRSP